MLTLLATKKYCKKIWVWLKHNWKIPFILVYTIVLWLVFRKKGEAHEILRIRSESYNAQIDAINKSHEEELQKRDKILEKYGETIKRIEEEYKKKNEKLDSDKRNAVKEIVEKHYNDPSALAKLIGEKFGFNYSEIE
jgi:hypothetical protein